jgi:hypothetical protein
VCGGDIVVVAVWGDCDAVRAKELGWIETDSVVTVDGRAVRSPADESDVIVAL